MVIRNWTVDVAPDAGVGVVLLMSVVGAAAFVLDAPRQHVPEVNEPPTEVPHDPEPLSLNTVDTSADVEAFTVNPSCEFATEVMKPAGYVAVLDE